MLFWYHFTSIIKLQLLGIGISFSSISFLSQTSLHKCSSRNTQLYNDNLISSLSAKHILSHNCVDSAIRFETSQSANTFISLYYGHTELNKTAFLVVHIEPKTHNKLVQISTKLHLDQTHALNLIATLPTCYKRVSIPAPCFRAKRAD